MTKEEGTRWRSIGRGYEAPRVGTGRAPRRLAAHVSGPASTIPTRRFAARFPARPVADLGRGCHAARGGVAARRRRGAVAARRRAGRRSWLDGPPHRGLPAAAIGDARNPRDVRSAAAAAADRLAAGRGDARGGGGRRGVVVGRLRRRRCAADAAAAARPERAARPRGVVRAVAGVARGPHAARGRRGGQHAVGRRGAGGASGDRTAGRVGALRGWRGWRGWRVAGGGVRFARASATLRRGSRAAGRGGDAPGARGGGHGRGRSRG